MILNEKELKKIPFKDSRGTSGMSGKLYLTESVDGSQYLVKSKPVDAANEFVAHRLAKMIGVPTSDAVLIKSNGRVRVGIAYEENFSRANMDDFRGTEEYEDDDIVFYNGGACVIHVPTEPKYLDDDPLLAELMAYLAFRNLIILQDNPQLAFVRGHLISFDYAESFFLSEEIFSGLIKGKGLAYAVNLFANRLFINNGYRNMLEVLHRPDTEFLRNAYFAPLSVFRETDFQPIFDDLDAVFPPSISAFYAACFDIIKRSIEPLVE